MVKFGKYLTQNRVAEWESQYIRYKKLKKTLKAIRQAQEERLLQKQREAQGDLSRDTSTSRLEEGDIENQRGSGTVSEEEMGMGMRGASASPAASISPLNRIKGALTLQPEGGGEEGGASAHSSSEASAENERHEVEASGRSASGTLSGGDGGDEALSTVRRGSGHISPPSHGRALPIPEAQRHTPLISLLGAKTFQLMQLQQKAAQRGQEVEMQQVEGEAGKAGSQQHEAAIPDAECSCQSDESPPKSDGGLPASRSSSALLDLPSPPSYSLLSIRPVLPSGLRQEPYERIFFELLEEDLLKVDAFYRRQETFFVENIERLQRQIRAFKAGDELTKKGIPRLRARRSGTEAEESEVTAADASHAAAAADGTDSDASRPRGSGTLTRSGSLVSSSMLRVRSKTARTKYKKKLSKSLQEVYRGLNLLKNYRILNFTAVVKILKKHDKMSQWKVSVDILPIVQEAYFFASPELEHSLERVEQLFTNNFAAGDRKKAMDTLRPGMPPLSSWLIFSLGFTVGIALILLGVFAGLMHWGLEDNQIPPQIIAIAPVFRCLFVLLIATWLWGYCVYQYQKHQLNWVFVLEVDWKRRLSFPQILSIACTGTLIYLLVVDLYLLLLVLKQRAVEEAEANPLHPELRETANYRMQPEWAHASMWLLILAIALCPFDIFYRSTRRYLFRNLYETFTAPFHSVLFKDVMTGDQLCSMVSVFGDVAYTICFYTTGDFHLNHGGRCHDINAQYVLWVVSFLPYWFRLMQCLRRYRDNGLKSNLFNSAKYCTSMVVTLTSLLDKTYGGPGTWWRAHWIVWAVISSCYSFGWDIIMDWGLWSGLSDPTSTDKFLRPKKSLESRWPYYFAMVSNLALRVVWVLTISPAYVDFFVHNDIKNFMTNSLEIIRRAQWNYYRLEYEHNGNVEQFRAVKMVPLPSLTRLYAEEESERSENLLEKTTKLKAEDMISAPVQPLLSGDVRKAQALAIAVPTPSKLKQDSALSPHANGAGPDRALPAARDRKTVATSLASPIAECDQEEGSEQDTGSDKQIGSSPSQSLSASPLATPADSATFRPVRIHMGGGDASPSRSYHVHAHKSGASGLPASGSRSVLRHRTGASVSKLGQHVAASRSASEFAVVIHGETGETDSSSDEEEEEDEEASPLDPEDEEALERALAVEEQWEREEQQARKKARRDKRRREIEGKGAEARDRSSSSHARTHSHGKHVNPAPPASANLPRNHSGRQLLRHSQSDGQPEQGTLSRNSSHKKVNQLAGSAEQPNASVVSVAGPPAATVPAVAVALAASAVLPSPSQPLASISSSSPAHPPSVTPPVSSTSLAAPSGLPSLPTHSPKTLSPIDLLTSTPQTEDKQAEEQQEQ